MDCVPFASGRILIGYNRNNAHPLQGVTLPLAYAPILGRLSNGSLQCGLFFRY